MIFEKKNKVIYFENDKTVLYVCLCVPVLGYVWVCVSFSLFFFLIFFFLFFPYSTIGLEVSIVEK